MKRILVIEDDDVIRKNLLHILEAENFEAWGANNGQSGLELSNEVLPDMILCDVMIPVLNGYEVLAEVRRNEKLSDVPFIFLTALADKANFRAGMDLGADDYLTKPFTRNELMKAIQSRLIKRVTATQKYAARIHTAEAEVHKLIHFDQTTDLPNRALFEQHLGGAMTHATASNESLCLFLIGLDRFDRLANTLEDATMDAFIFAIAGRLSNCLRDIRVTFARAEFDQFALALRADDSFQLEASIQAVKDCFLKPMNVNGLELLITCSIGIAFYPEHGLNSEELLHNARTALSSIRVNGTSQHKIFCSETFAERFSELTLEADLSHALERGELELHYQPQVDIHTGIIIGGEALLRWNSATRGTISPARFIPIAEESGLILLIGEWVFRQACSQALAWQNAGIPVRVAVNLSPRQFAQADLADQVIRILQESGVEPNRLELEITESVLMVDPEMAAKTVHKLHATGIHISIDDFGTGYCSFSHLKRFPFNTLKLDRSFVQSLPEDSRNRAITDAIIRMSHALNMDVVAEGVENSEELKILKSQGCNLMQGFLFSRPLKAADFERMLLAQQHRLCPNAIAV